jgi:hypothetical protein
LTCSQPDPFAGSCPAERRVLFGLAAVAISGRVPSSLGVALAESDPVTLAQDAQRLQVHTLIGPVLARHPDLAEPLPADLVLFFRAMHAANRHRLSEGLAQLEEIGAALKAGNISAIVLKGGGDMLSPLHADPAIRYVGDLDILVSADCARDALAALRELGAAPAAPPAHETSRFDWRGQRLSEHHLPRMVRPGWTFPVEIHVHAGPGAVATVLDPAAMLDRRVPTILPGLSIACAEDRACHLITHATRHNGMVSLRAWVDWSMLRRHCNRAAVASRLGRAGHGQAFESFEVMANLLEAGGARDMSRNETAIARAVICKFGSAGAASTLDLPLFLFRRCRGLLLSPTYRRHIIARFRERGVFCAFASLLGHRRSDGHSSGKLKPRQRKD